MADPDIEFFGYELFNRLWLDYGLISEPFPRCFDGRRVEESKLTDDIVSAVKLRQAMYHNHYKLLFDSRYEDFADSTSDFQDYLTIHFPHRPYRDCPVMETVLAACAFVAEMCQYCHAQKNDFFLSKCYLNWAMYVDAFLSRKFYSSGGWLELHRSAQWYKMPFLFLKENSNTSDTAFGANYICHSVHKTIKAISSMRRFVANDSYPERSTTLKWVDYCLQDGPTPSARDDDSRKVRDYTVEELEDAILTLKGLCNPIACSNRPFERMDSKEELPPESPALSESLGDKNQSSSGEGGKDPFKLPPKPEDANDSIDADLELLNNQLSKSNLDSRSSAVEISTNSKTSRSESLAREQSSNSREDLKSPEISPSEPNTTDDLQSAIKSLNDDLLQVSEVQFSNLDLNSSPGLNPCHETEISQHSQPAKNRTSDNMNSSNKSPDNVLRSGFDNVLSDIDLNQSSVKTSPNPTRNSLSEKRRRSGGKENPPSNITGIKSARQRLSPAIMNLRSPKAYEVKNEDQTAAMLSNLDLNSSSPDKVSPNHTSRNSGVVRRSGGKGNSPYNIESSRTNVSPPTIFLDSPSSPSTSDVENNQDPFEAELPGLRRHPPFPDAIGIFPSYTRSMGAERDRMPGVKENSPANKQSPRSKLSPAILFGPRSIQSTTVAREDKETCEVMEHNDSETTTRIETAGDEFPSTPNNAKMERNKEQIIAKVMEKSKSMTSRTELIFEDPSPSSSSTAEVKGKDHVVIQIEDCQSIQKDLFREDPSPSTSNTAEVKCKDRVGIQVEDCQSTQTDLSREDPSPSSSNTVELKGKDHVVIQIEGCQSIQKDLFREDPSPSSSNTAEVKCKDRVGIQVEDCQSTQTDLSREDPSPSSSNTVELKGKDQVVIQIEGCQSIPKDLFREDPSPSSSNTSKGKDQVGIQVEDCQSTIHAELASQIPSELPSARNTSAVNKKKKKKKGKKAEPTVTETTGRDTAAGVDVRILRRMILVLGSPSGLQFVQSTLESRASGVSEPPTKK